MKDLNLSEMTIMQAEREALKYTDDQLATAWNISRSNSELLYNSTEAEIADMADAWHYDQLTKARKDRFLKNVKGTFGIIAELL